MNPFLLFFTLFLPSEQDSELCALRSMAKGVYGGFVCIVALMEFVPPERYLGTENCILIHKRIEGARLCSQSSIEAGNG